MRQIKVLVVDNEPIIRTAFRDRLNHEGYSCDAVGTAEEALNKVNGVNYNLIFLDLSLGEKDNLRTLSQALKDGSGGIIVGISGHVRSYFTGEDLKFCDEFRTKPLLEREIFAILEKYGLEATTQ